MKELKPEQLISNYEILISIIQKHISEPRLSKLLKLYSDIKDKVLLAPASGNKSYHNSFPGGYVDHILNVIKCCESSYNLWKEMGANMDNFTYEELIFSAINHDLGKIGDGKEEFYLPNDSEWHVKNTGAIYKHNEELEFMTTFERTMYLLNQYEIPLSKNEIIGIKMTDGLFDESNKPYYITYSALTRPRTCLPYILHHSDMMASRIEFEQWFNIEYKIKNKPKNSSVTSKPKTENTKFNKLLNKI